MSVVDPLETPDRIAVLGDVHGDWGFGSRALLYARERDANVVLQAGDFGFWRPGEAFLAGMSAVAVELNLPILWVDGNHENHPALSAIPIDPDTGLRPIAPGIWHLPRGFRWTWKGLRFLALGGAHSVDRTSLVPYLDWFPEESLSRHDVEHVLAAGETDVMLCHDAPAGVDTPGLQPGKWPEVDVRAASQHRETVRHVVDQVRPRWLFHGHYHVSYMARLAGAGYQCTVQGLAHNKAALLERAVCVRPLRHLIADVAGDARPSFIGSGSDAGRRTSRSR